MDELGDKGFSKSDVRFRVMNDCFFILLRSYTRIDHELVRILDTRIFHEFGSKNMIRDFQHREGSYESLKSRGFNPFDSEWSLSPS